MATYLYGTHTQMYYCTYTNSPLLDFDNFGELEIIADSQDTKLKRTV